VSGLVCPTMSWHERQRRRGVWAGIGHLGNPTSPQQTLAYSVSRWRRAVLRVGIASADSDLCRKAHCPQFLPNYINLEPNNHSGSDQIFRDNTVYFLDSTSCVLQNHWFTSRVDDTMYGPYFLDVSLPPMRSVRCGVTSWPKKQIPKLYKRSSDF
jgi:hypothetical protein